MKLLDNDALRDLLTAHQDAVYNVCWQVLRQDQDAQDAAQQVLLHLIDDLPKINDAEHLRRWIYRASFQVALDVRKKRRRRMNHEQKARPAAAPSEETVELVHEHVAALDDDLRALLAEHYFEQRPLEALAQARGVSTAAVWKKLERAKERLRESITRAGFAAALPDLERLLTSHRRVSAPKGLLAAGVLEKVATAGSIALQVKLIAAASLVVAGALTYGILHQRSERAARKEPEAPVARRAVVPKAPSRAPEPVASPPVQEPMEALDAVAFMLAFQKAMEIEDIGSRWKEYRRIGIRLQDEDFRRAESQINVKRGTRDYFTAAYGSIMKIWLSADGKRVIDLFRTLPPQQGVSKAEGTRNLLVNFAHFAPDTVLAYAKQLPEEEGRSALVELLSPMTASGAREAAARAEQLPKGNERDEALRKALSAWSNSDFQAAADWTEAFLQPQERKAVLWAVLEGMGGRQNSRAAAEVCLKIFEGKELYSLAVEQVVKWWSESDPASAAAFVLRLPIVEQKGRHSNPRIYLSCTVGLKWALRDPAAALAWAEQLPRGEERQETLRVIGGALVKSVRSDPSQALGLVQTLPENERLPAMEVIVAAWAELDPPAAAAVALSFPGGPVGTDAIARAWAARDVEGALGWARTLASVELRDAAVREIEKTRQEMKKLGK